MRVGWVIHFWLLNGTHFVWLDGLTIPVNNPINIFLINPNIVLYYIYVLYISWNIYAYLKH